MPRGVKGSGVKTCIDCGVAKQLKALERCNSCYGRYSRKRNPELVKRRERKAYHNNRTKKLAQNKRWRESNKQLVYEISRKTLAKVEAIKTASPCADCNNYFPPECMDFDHRDSVSKRDNVSHLVVGRYSWAVIQEEIDKCDIVCANCHRIRTKRRAELKRKAA